MQEELERSHFLRSVESKMIIPGILEEKFEKVEEKIKLIEEVSPIFQIDIVDNTLVPGKTFLEVEKLGQLETKSEITVHLMVENPIKYISKPRSLFPFTKRKIVGVSTVITQLTDTKTLEEFIKISKHLGYKIGLSINSDQDISLLSLFIDKVDLVQFMSVVPGKQGNDFIPAVLERIKEFKKAYPSTLTQIDGGIDEITLPSVLETGVDNIVVGSAIFNSEDPIQKFLDFSSFLREDKEEKV